MQKSPEPPDKGQTKPTRSGADVSAAAGPAAASARVAARPAQRTAKVRRDVMVIGPGTNKRRAPAGTLARGIAAVIRHDGNGHFLGALITT